MGTQLAGVVDRSSATSWANGQKPHPARSSHCFYCVLNPCAWIWGVCARTRAHMAMCERARARLATADLLRDEEPFVAIHVGAGAESLPMELVDKMQVSARMVIPVGPRGHQVGLRGSSSRLYARRARGTPCWAHGRPPTNQLCVRASAFRWRPAGACIGTLMVEPHRPPCRSWWWWRRMPMATCRFSQ
jgi:hypothetical protein